MSVQRRDDQEGKIGEGSPLTPLPGRPAHPHFENRYSVQIEMVRTERKPVAVPEVPSGYLLRQFRQGDEDAYNELFHLAFEDGDTLERTRATALDEGLFVIEHLESGHLVATCAAQEILNERHPQGGQLGWLVGDPSHAGKKLGTIVSAAVTNRLLNAGYPLPYLETNDFRYEAISIYLKLGWRPYVFADDMEVRWRNVYEGMGRKFQPADAVFAD